MMFSMFLFGANLELCLKKKILHYFFSGSKKGHVRVRRQCKTCKQKVFPTNMSSLQNKTDKLWAKVNHLHECRGASILASTGTWLKHDDDNNASAIGSLLMTQFCSVPPPLSCSAAICRGEWHFLTGVEHQQSQTDGGELLQEQMAAVTTVAHTSPDGKEY